MARKVLKNSQSQNDLSRNDNSSELIEFKASTIIKKDRAVSLADDGTVSLYDGSLPWIGISTISCKIDQTTSVAILGSRYYSPLFQSNTKYYVDSEGYLGTSPTSHGMIGSTDSENELLIEKNTIGNNFVVEQLYLSENISLHTKDSTGIQAKDNNTNTAILFIFSSENIVPNAL